MGSRYLMMFGPVLLAAIAASPFEASSSSRISHSSQPAPATAYIRDATAMDPYRDGYREGHQHGLKDAADRNCRRPLWWRPRAWYERLTDPWAHRQRYLGYFDGYEAAYREVCPVIRPKLD